MPDVRASEVVSQSWSVVRMASCQLLLLLLLGVTSARGSEEAMTELKRNIFYHYDTNVIPQEVSENNEIMPTVDFTTCFPERHGE